MKVIRDEETHGLMMIPLFVDWGIRRCNVEGCREKPTTIITGLHPNAQHTGWCEKHYQEFKNTGTFEGTIIFDDYDAFKQSRRHDHE